MQDFLDRVIDAVGRPPKYLVTDQGKEFVAEEFKGAWCQKHGITQRFGAVGKYPFDCARAAAAGTLRVPRADLRSRGTAPSSAVHTTLLSYHQGPSPPCSLP
jgi:hypothetical protein